MKFNRSIVLGAMLVGFVGRAWRDGWTDPLLREASGELSAAAFALAMHWLLTRFEDRPTEAAQTPPDAAPSDP